MAACVLAALGTERFIGPEPHARALVGAQMIVEAIQAVTETNAYVKAYMKAISKR